MGPPHFRRGRAEDGPYDTVRLDGRKRNSEPSAWAATSLAVEEIACSIHEKLSSLLNALCWGSCAAIEANGWNET
jgi:hypothetical protein